MANLFKEILHGIREELAFERAQPYRATLAASEAAGFSNTQLRDKLSGLRRSVEADPGAIPSISASEPRIPNETLNQRLERVASEKRQPGSKEISNVRKAEPVTKYEIPYYPVTPDDYKDKNSQRELKESVDWDIVNKTRAHIRARSEVLNRRLNESRRINSPSSWQGTIWFIDRVIEDFHNYASNEKLNPDARKLADVAIDELKNKKLELEKSLSALKGVNIPLKEKQPADPEFNSRDLKIAEFFGKHQRGELKMEEYDTYRELIEVQIKALEERLKKTKNQEEQVAIKLQISRRSGEYTNITGHQIDMLIANLRSGKIEKENIKDQFSRIKSTFEANKAGMPQFEIDASKIYLEKVGAELGFVQTEAKPAVVVPGVEAIKEPESWDEILSSADKIGEVKYRGVTLSADSIRNRILRVRNEFGRLKGREDGINAPTVREAIANLPQEFKQKVIAVLESESGAVSKTSPIETKPSQDVKEVDSLTQKVLDAKTWDDLDKAIREAGFVKSGEVEYSPVDVLAPITDLRDALKMANGNIKAPVFMHAFGSVTRANGIRAKVLELLFSENDEKYFKAGDRVVYEGKKWDIIRIENGKAVIHTLSEDKKEMVDRIVPLADLAPDIKSVEPLSELEEDFEKPAQTVSAAGPETTAIPEEVPQWKREFQAQVNKSFEAYRGRFYRRYRDKDEVYAEYQRGANSGWRGWLADRYASFSTFGITDFHAAERFRAGTNEIGNKLESAANLLVEESVENNETAIKYTVESILGKIVRQFDGKRGSDGRPILTDEKLKSIEDRLIIELRAVQQEKVLRDRGELTKILREGLDQKWWTRYVYGTVGTTLASINLSYAVMPMIEKWISGSGVAVPPKATESVVNSLIKNATPNAIDSIKNIPSAWDLAVGENPWSVSEKLLRMAGKTVNPDTIKLVDAALCRENGIGVPEWAIPGKLKHGAVAVGTTLKIANALRVIASMP